jgi:hypothetical protein
MASDQQDPSSAKKQNQFNSYLKYSGLTIQLLVSMGVSGWLGFKLDQYLGLRFPVFMLLFGLMAFAGMLYLVYRSFNQP